MKRLYSKAALLSAALVMTVAFAQAPKYRPFDLKPSRADEAWIRKTLRSMSVDEKIGQMFSADANLTFWNRESEAYKKLEHHIVDNKVGTVILFRSEVWPSAVLANRWQRMAKTPLLISADLEMGPGMRFDDTPWWAPNMAVAATGDTKWARLQGEATAIQARATGVNWIYAPSADVNNNPDNPVINTRSFGEDPETVSKFVRAFIEGVQGAGAMACAKHFPGHGDTSVDSHIGLPVVDVPRSRLEALELIPFRAAIDSGVASIMSSHIALPRIEPERAAPVRALSEKEAEKAEFVSKTEETSDRQTLPATLSQKIMSEMLRRDLGFTGIVTTDAMSMAGVAARYTPAEAAVLAVRAGADLVLKSPDIDAAVAGLKEAVSKGEVPISRIDSSVERILRAKAALGLHRQRFVDLEEVDRIVAAPRYNEIAQQIADASMTLIRDRRKLLPLKASAPPILNLTFTDEEDRNIERPFVDALREGGARVESHHLDLKSNDADLARALSAAESGKFDAVVYSVAVRARSGKGSVALPDAGKRIAAELFKRDLPLLVISFGNPYLLAAIPETPSCLLAWSPFPVSQRAAARALLGQTDISGTSPISLPGIFSRGDGIRVTK
ncbi:MAG: hypothetical protein IPM66_23760 [Acidobacteriota bacterium]|nr:MAG: hypothetical protein IPM66_23760 [Acidobacteriota bacterium]